MTLAVRPLHAPGSPLASLDPRWKLAALVVAAAVVAVLHSIPATAVALLGSLVLVWLAHLSWSYYAARLGSVIPFLAVLALSLPLLIDDRGPAWTVGPLHVSRHGLAAVVVVSLKSLAIVTLMLVALLTAPLNQMLHAAHRLRVPSLLVHLTLLTYRYVFLLSHELGRLRIALRVRGYRNRATLHSYRTIGHVAGTLLVRSHDQAERVGQAMRCRGFDGRFRSLANFQTRGVDVAGFMAIVASAGALLAWDLLR